MRAPRSSLLVVLLTLAGAGCKSTKHDDAKWMAPPKSYDPLGGDLTFNTKNLDAFNTMSEDERTAFLEKLKGSKGTFKGQALYQRSEELTDKIDDRVHGQYDVWLTVDKPVYLEITVEYHVFFDAPQLVGLAGNTPVEFTGTFIEMVYEDEAKPRRMDIKVKGDAINVLK